MNNKWKVMAIVEAILIVVVAVFVIGYMAGKDNESQLADNTADNQQTVTTAENPTTMPEETKANDETTKAQEETTATADEEITAFEVVGADNGLKVTFKEVNKWGDESMYYYGYTIELENTGKEKIENWAIKVPVPEDFKVDASWNGEVVVDGGYLYVAPVDFNSVVEAGAKMDSVGMNVATKEILDFSKMVVGTKGEEIATEGEKKTESSADSDKQTGGNALTDYQGKLTVKGTNLVNEDGQVVQLRGISTHGLAWFPDYVNYDSFKALKNMGANTVRLAMYTYEDGGYCAGGNQSKLKQLVHDGVKYASELDMYVIIDWHVLNDRNPNTYKDAAKDFFEEMSKTYADYDNVIYEICNEPNGDVSWEAVKSYAEEVIPVIRKNDSDGIILVGTPTWSQDVDKAAANPIKDVDNLMYVLHFYAATHKDDLRNRMVKAIEGGLPIFISEFSICDASGNGGLDYDSANKWLEVINKYNIGYVGWNLSNKNESSAIIKQNCSKTSGYTMDDLSDSGKWLVETFK